MTEKEKMIEYWTSYYGEANAKHITEVQLADRKAILDKVKAEMESIIEYWNRAENSTAMSDALYHNIECAKKVLNLADEMTKGTE